MHPYRRTYLDVCMHTSMPSGLTAPLHRDIPPSIPIVFHMPINPILTTSQAMGVHLGKTIEIAIWEPTRSADCITAVIGSTIHTRLHILMPTR